MKRDERKPITLPPPLYPLSVLSGAVRGRGGSGGALLCMAWCEWAIVYHGAIKPGSNASVLMYFCIDVVSRCLMVIEALGAVKRRRLYDHECYLIGSSGVVEEGKTDRKMDREVK
ncbi:hypothetical protein E2C01_064944 [Portunus trituberculatus]|uniref:Uncharacterized protein n=1 Tax=Portunus trituberculatus TaxID=210409 RepID=A0A5B7HLQ3_PORTR|nr:hypothetical protein [Portunus trituberculatus]